MAMDIAADERRWDAFIEVCRKEGMAEAAVRWYVVRIERYLKAHDRPADQHESSDVLRYLEAAGRNASVPGWRFRQLVHALQLFHCQVVRASWSRDFDWQYWLDSARELEPSHPTVARHNYPISTVAVETVKATDADRLALAAIENELIAKIRLKNYSIRTEHAYVHWLRRYARFHGDRDPRQLGNDALARYLNHLALEREVSPSTQNQALSALVFVYEHVIQRPVGAIDGLVPARKPRRLPTVMTRAEVRILLAAIDEGPLALLIGLLYGTGMRLMECVRLRVKDVDFGYSQIVVRDGKGQKDRVVPLPQRYRAALESQIQTALALHSDDVARDYGEVFMPDALARKYPTASREPGWQYVFPSGRLSVDPRSGKVRRHHLHVAASKRVPTALSQTTSDTSARSAARMASC